ncbi:MAG: DUF2470 domain-containing protein [Pseudomonadota bacterium]
MNKQKSIKNARTLLRSSELGVLSTHSKANEGFPFGSVSTYMSTMQGDAIFYISDLAQHTKNILHDPKMCLTVFQGADGESASDEDPNAGARLSLLGSAALLPEAELEETAERFFQLYPQSRSYQKTHDFAFYKLTTERARFIGGFGDIHWISQAEWALETPEWLDNEQAMIQHMNEDHMDAMQLMVNHHFGIETEQIEMLQMNPDGCFLKPDQCKPVYIPFDELAHTGTEARARLVKLTHEARAALAQSSH